MPSIWNPISPKKKTRQKSSRYEGNAEQLVDYALIHTSPRSLRAIRVATEVKRAIKDSALPTVAEIQGRHNFTEEAAQSFIRSMKRVMQRNASLKLTVEKPKQALSKSSGPQIQQDSAPLTPPLLKPQIDVLQAVLQNIRSRYGEEIRIHGEQTLVREGFIYIVTHPCFSGWVKAGMTIDYELRLVAYNVSDPLSRFELRSVKWVIDRRLAEKQLLETLSEHAEEMRGEWARMELAVASSLLETS